MLTDQIIPSLEMLEAWEKEHRVMGGFFEGQRSGTMIIEAEDNMELDRMLASLPIMGVYDVDVAPVDRARDRLGAPILVQTPRHIACTLDRAVGRGPRREAHESDRIEIVRGGPANDDAHSRPRRVSRGAISASRPRKSR